MRVIVAGGRDYDDMSTVARVLGLLYHEITLIHGDCPTGLDAHSKYLWQLWGNIDEPHPADWDGPCKPTCRPGHRRAVLGIPNRCPAAGPYRNEEMAAATADLCIAFPGGSGTEDMVRRAKAHGIPVLRVEP